VDDTRQHWKGRDTHRGAKKEHGFEERRLFRKQFGVMKKAPTEPRTQQEGGDHTRSGNHHGTLEFLADDIDTEFHAHHEHVEREAELGGGKEITLGIAQGLGFIPGKKSGLGFRPEQSEKGGAKQDACDHFSDDLGLSETGRNGAYESAEKEDDSQLEEELDGKVEVVHGTPVYTLLSL